MALEKLIHFNDFFSRLNTTQSAFDAVMLPGYNSTVVLEFRSEDPTVDGLMVQLSPGDRAAYYKKAPPTPASIYHEGINQAQIEGWAVFDVDGRWQLMRDDDRGLFKDDVEALLFVAARANEGDELHLAAISMIGTKVND